MVIPVVDVHMLFLEFLNLLKIWWLIWLNPEPEPSELYTMCGLELQQRCERAREGGNAQHGDEHVFILIPTFFSREL